MSTIGRIFNCLPQFLLGTSSEVLGKSLRASYKGVLDPATKKYAGGLGFKQTGKQFKDAFIAVEKHDQAMKKQHGNFFKQFIHDVKTTPKMIGDGWKNAAAGKTGIGKFFAQSKGALKGLGKRMPMIGSLMILAFELPNIIKATADGGIFAGAAEAGKAGSRLAGGMLCAAIGSALLPGVGSLIGFFVGDWITSKLVGKSFSEKKTEQEEKLAQNQEQTPNMPNNSAASAQNPAMSNPYATANSSPELQKQYQQLYGGGSTNMMDKDFMMMSSGLDKMA